MQRIDQQLLDMTIPRRHFQHPVLTLITLVGRQHLLQTSGLLLRQISSLSRILFYIEQAPFAIAKGFAVYNNFIIALK